MYGKHIPQHNNLSPTSLLVTLTLTAFVAGATNQPINKHRPEVNIFYSVWGVGIISSPVFGHLETFKGWIQTEACVIPSYHGIRNRETNRDIISVAVVPSKNFFFVQPKLMHNNVHLIRYTCSTILWDSLYECLVKEMCL